MVVGCARAGGCDGSSGKLSVGILFANPGGFGLCMRGVVAVGDDNPTDILVPRVSLGHMVTSCTHAPWTTAAWECVEGRGLCVGTAGAWQQGVGMYAVGCTRLHFYNHNQSLAHGHFVQACPVCHRSVGVHGRAWDGVLKLAWGGVRRDLIGFDVAAAPWQPVHGDDPLPFSLGSVDESYPLSSPCASSRRPFWIRASSCTSFTWGRVRGNCQRGVPPPPPPSSECRWPASLGALRIRSLLITGCVGRWRA